MRKKIIISFTFILILFIIIFVVYHINYADTKNHPVTDKILNSIDDTIKCESNRDCVMKSIGCRSGICWNKNNMPEPIINKDPGLGMCMPTPEVSKCVCDRYRCQPSEKERTKQTYNYQSCTSNDNCYSDEVCLDYNYMSKTGVEHRIKSIDSVKKQCYPVCNSNTDCPLNMSCTSAKLIPEKIRDNLWGKKDWAVIPEIINAEIVKYCDF